MNLYWAIWDLSVVYENFLEADNLYFPTNWKGVEIIEKCCETSMIKSFYHYASNEHS